MMYIGYNRLCSISQIEKWKMNMNGYKKRESKRRNIAGQYLVLAQIIGAFVFSFGFHLPGFFIVNSLDTTCNVSQITQTNGKTI